MDIPEDVGRLLDSERVKRAVAHCKAAQAEIMNARDALVSLPSGRDILSLLGVTANWSDDPRDRLRAMRDALDMLTVRLDTLAERCP